MALTVAELLAVLRADTSGFDGPMRNSERQVQGFGQTTDNLNKSLSGTTKFLGEMSTVAAGFATVLGTKVAHAGVQMNSMLETATIQFKTLLGGTETAATIAVGHVRDLFDFAKETPFETAPIIDASRMLQTFGGSALNSMKGIRMIGDASAGTSASIQEVSFWVGRLYSMLKGGRPFGEAAMRLQELAILSPDVRSEMERLQQKGVDWNQIWGVFTKDMERFNGAMKEQAGTWKGLTSTISDTFQLFAADVTKPLFDSFKNLMNAFVEFSNSPEFSKLQEALNKVFASIGGAIDKVVVKITEAVSAFRADPIIKESGRIMDQYGALIAASAGLAVSLSSAWLSSIPLISAFAFRVNPVIGVFSALLLSSKEGREAIFDLAMTVADLAKTLAATLAPIIATLANVLRTVLIAAVNILNPILKVMADNSELVSSALLGIAAAVAGLKLIGLITTAVTFATTLISNVIPAILAFISSLTAAQVAMGAFGLAVAAVAFAFTLSSRGSKEAEARVKDYQSALESAEGSARKLTDEITTRSIIGNKDFGNEVAKSTENVDAFVDAVNSNSRALAKAGAHFDSTLPSLDQWQKYTKSTKGSTDEFDIALRRLYKQTKGDVILIDDVVEALGEQRKALAAARDEQDKYNKVLGDPSREKALKDAASSMTEYEVAQLKMSRANADFIKEVTQKGQEFNESINRSFSSATSVVQAFATDTEVTKDKVMQFLNDMINATRNWSTNLKDLAAMGLDEGLLKELAAAGPKAAPLVQALLDQAREAGVESINQTQRDLRDIMTSTGNFLGQIYTKNSIDIGLASDQIAKGWAAGVDKIGPTTYAAMRATGETFERSWAVMTEVAASGGKKTVQEIATALGMSIPEVERIIRAAQAHIDSLKGKTVDVSVNFSPEQMRQVAELDEMIARLSSVNINGGPVVEKRAYGGPVKSGFPYIVGDGGKPELFVPKSDGMILPFVPNAPNAMAGNVSGGGGYNGNGATPTTINLVLDGRVIAQVVRDDLIRVGRANGSALGQYA